MAGSRRKKTGGSTGSTSENLGPIRLEDIPWAEIIIEPEPQPQAETRQRSEASFKGPDIVVPVDQVPDLGEALGRRTFPLLPVLVLALAVLCLLALGTGVTSDF